ncbi:MAG: diguanylate cyclase [Casimicrobiaceae bacterium]
MNQQRKRRFSLTRHKRSLWALPAFGALMVAALWGAQWYQLRATEQALLTSIAQDTEHYAASFEQFVTRMIKDIDRAALLVKFEYEQHGEHDLARLMRAGVVEGSGVAQVSIIDARGDLLATNFPRAWTNVADRAHFQLHSAQDTGLLDISKPIRQRATGNTVIQFTRRLNNRDGSFAGIVLLSLSPEQITEFYDESDLHAYGSLGLVGLDGTVRARRVGSESTTVDDGSGAWVVARAALNPKGFFEATSAADGVARFVAYRRLPEYPFVVTTAQARDEALAGFHRNRATRLALAVAATAAILAFFAVVTVLAIRLQRHRRELKVQHHFLQTLLDNVPSGISVRSMRPPNVGRFVVWNEANEALLGIKAGDALGKTVDEVLPPEAAARVLELDRTLLASPMVQEIVNVGDIGPRRRRTLHFVRAPIFGADDEVDYIISSGTDITGDQARSDELRLASKVFETTVDGIMLTDADDRIIMVNSALSRLTGYAAEELLGKTLAESSFRPIDLAESDARMAQLNDQGFVTGEVARFRKDGTPLSLWVTATTVRDAGGTITNYVRVFTDISLLKATQEKLEQLASFDPLTGLPNRRLLQDRLGRALLRAERNKNRMALMFIDLDRFKKVNDTLGHDIGDLLLRGVASRLQKCIRASDSVGRFGGDEFAIVLEDTAVPNDAKRVAERIVASLAEPFHLNGHAVRTAASIGIAFYPTNGIDAATLLRNADMAMYEAKRSGSNRFEFFSDGQAEMAPVL